MFSDNQSTASYQPNEVQENDTQEIENIGENKDDTIIEK